MTELCISHGLPVLSARQHDFCLGRSPAQLGVGAFGRAFLNEEEGLVVKVAFDWDFMPSFLTEAKAMGMLQGTPGVQHLVGICPERLSLVTRYGGPTLQQQLQARALSWREKTLMAVKLTDILRAIHAQGLAHCDLKCNNICVDASQGDPEVTIIDFGLCSRRGQAVDVGCLGSLLEGLFPEGRMAPSLEDWLCRDDDEDADEGQALDRLSEALRAQLDLTARHRSSVRGSAVRSLGVRRL